MAKKTRTPESCKMAREDGLTNEWDAAAARAQEAAVESGLLANLELVGLAAEGDDALRAHRSQLQAAQAAAAPCSKTPRAHRAQANNVISELKILATGEEVSV